MVTRPGLTKQFMRYVPRGMAPAGFSVTAQFRLWRYCFKQLQNDQLLTVAGDLTFQTLLGLIPLLVIALMVINLWAGGPELGHRVQEKVFEALNIDQMQIVMDGEEVNLSNQIDSLVASVQARMTTAAVLGLGAIVTLAMSIFITLESAVNRIWRVPQGRSLAHRFLVWILILFLGPIVIALSIQVTSWIWSLAESTRILPDHGWMSLALGAGRWLVELVSVWFVLFLVYQGMPSVPVHPRASISAAIVAGTLWHLLAKKAFVLYLAHAVGYRQIYGSLALVPLFFLWIYVTWIFVMFGCELAYMVQNHRSLAEAAQTVTIETRAHDTKKSGS